MTLKSHLEIFASILKAVGILLFSIFYIFESWILFFVPRRFRRHDIKGKITLITGGGSGLGRLIAAKMAKKGSKIVVWDINREGNEETAQQIRKSGGTCHAYTVNVCDRKVVYEIAKKVREDVGKVDILINNAGIVWGRNFLDLSDDMIVKTFEVNTISHFWTVKAFLPEMMRENSGQIVTIASLAGKMAGNYLVDYSASKFADVGFDEALKLELIVDGYSGIFTTCVCPYLTNTGMFTGVQTKIFQLLEPDYVASEAVDGILMRESEVTVPRTLAWFATIKCLLPNKTWIALCDELGAFSTMKTYTGRKNS